MSIIFEENYNISMTYLIPGLDSCRLFGPHPVQTFLDEAKKVICPLPHLRRSSGHIDLFALRLRFGHALCVAHRKSILQGEGLPEHRRLLGGMNMDWNRAFEVEDGEGGRVSITLAEIEGLLTSNLTRDELDELGGHLIIYAEFDRQRIYE
jgi:hypothetical protein